MLGLAITLPMALLSGPLAGYLVSQWIIQKWHVDPSLTLVLVLLGLGGSIVQTVRLIRLLYQESRKNRS